MRTAIVQNSVVVNVIEAPGDYAPEGAISVASDQANIGDTWNGTTFTPPPIVPPTPPTADDLVALAASARFKKETGGITVIGIPIATDRESQAMLNGAFNFVQVNSTATIKWKSDAGFVELTAAQIMGLALAVGTHVQACFAKEADVNVGISAQPPTITTAAQIADAFAAVSTAY